MTPSRPTRPKVRLAAIDAPELNQPYGGASKDDLSRRVAGRFVVVDWQKRDRYKRIVGKVLMGDRDVCLEQVRAGLACHGMALHALSARADAH